MFFGSVFSSFWHGQKKHTKKNRQRVFFFLSCMFFGDKICWGGICLESFTAMGGFSKSEKEVF